MDENKKPLLIVLFFGVLMGALDISIVGPALPSIEKSLNLDQRSLSWVFNIFILFNLMALPLMTRMSDLYGRRNIFIFSTILFGIGSAITGISDTLNWLLVGRAVQGFGASGIFPVATAVVGDVFPVEKRGRILGLLGAVFGIAFIIGPIIAGVILNYFQWNSLFLINIPLSLLLIVGAIKYVPAIKIISPKSVDWPGIILLSLILFGFTWSLNNLEPDNLLKSISNWRVLPFIFLTLVFTYLFVLRERKALNPVIKLGFFRNKQIRMVGYMAIGTGVFQSATVFIPKMTVDVFNVSESQASFMMIPFVVAIAIGSPLAGRGVDRFGSRIMIIVSMILTSAGMFLFSRHDQHLFTFYTAGIIMGFGLSIVSGSSLRYIMLNEVQAVDRAISQGMITIFIASGQLSGAAVFSALIASAGYLRGFSMAFDLMTVIALIMLVASFQLKNRTEELKSAAA